MSESNNNEEFVYPELTGRRRIYSDVDKITKGNIFEVLQKAMIVHMQNSNESVSPGKGNAYADVFGTNLDYTRSISTTQKLPITEESLIWCGSMPIINSDNSFDWKTADYTVAGIADGLNQLVVALKARKKNA